MAFEFEKDYEQAVVRIKKTCRVVYVILWVLFVFAIMFFSVGIVLGILLFLSVNIVPVIGRIDPLSFLSFVIFAILTILVLRNALLLLKDVLSDIPPFSLKQANRIRNISYLLFGKVLLDLIIPTRIVPLEADPISFSYEIIQSPALLININVETLIMASLFFCISLIFKYGVLLQKDTRGFL